MRILTTALSALVSVSAFAQADRYSAVLSAAQGAWPGPQTVAIACNYADASPAREIVQALAQKLPPGSVINVADVRGEVGLIQACNSLKKTYPHYLLLLREDPLYFDGGFLATRLVRHMNHLSVPTLATLPIAIRQGALAVAGPETNNTLLVNEFHNQRGIVGPATVEPMKNKGMTQSTPFAGVAVNVVASFR